MNRRDFVKKASAATIGALIPIPIFASDSLEFGKNYKEETHKLAIMVAVKKKDYKPDSDFGSAQSFLKAFFLAETFLDKEHKSQSWNGVFVPDKIEHEVEYTYYEPTGMDSKYWVGENTEVKVDKTCGTERYIFRMTGKRYEKL